MMTGPLVAIVLCYGLLGLLLLSLNLASLWHWWVKAGAIVVTILACGAGYFAIGGLLGWPSAGALPARFSLLAARVVEPNAALAQTGHIYFWVEEIDDDQLPIAPPRAFEVPFDPNLFTKVAEAQQILDEGGSVLGEFDKSDAIAATDADEERQDDIGMEGLSRGGDGDGLARGEGARFDSDSAAKLNFSLMPPTSLPAKSVIE
jgi:hypothetical protein